MCTHSPPELAFEEASWTASMPRDLSFLKNDADLGKDYPEDAKAVYFMGDAHTERSGDWAVLVDGLKPVEKIEAEIDQIRAKLQGPYTAVHMRIEKDWQKYRDGAYYVPASRIVSQTMASRAFMALGSPNIFVATGMKEEAISAWAGANVIAGRDPQEMMSEDPSWTWTAFSIIDFEICKRAHLLVGMECSAFYKSLSYYRNLKGLPSYHYNPKMGGLRKYIGPRYLAC